MQIKLLDQVFECYNQISALESVFEEINQVLIETNQNLKCFEIDGIELYEEYDQYIVDHIEDIQTIVIKVKTLKELVDDTFLLIKDYVTRGVPEIDTLADEFYHDVNQETWNKFTHLLDGLHFVINSLSSVSENQDCYYNASQFIVVHNNLLKQIVMLQEAMESQDRVRLCDVLIYEIIPSFTALQYEINKNIQYGQVQ